MKFKSETCQFNRTNGSTNPDNKNANTINSNYDIHNGANMQDYTNFKSECNKNLKGLFPNYNEEDKIDTN